MEADHGQEATGEVGACTLKGLLNWISSRSAGCGQGSTYNAGGIYTYMQRQLSWKTTMADFMGGFKLCPAASTPVDGARDLLESFSLTGKLPCSWACCDCECFCGKLLGR